ncbi:hypothetical protein TUMSATVNIG1_16520 [Vibrio nigripulchritudo]|uniref:hypothetical protein n=1 Tax=Vibrio nigripulchritudo TaxID=28173 RepID=UPI00190A4144|nr:hypothetical protein [Vibrio nigripulchritudo]BCL69696.1 hypothetical protein VNTUMSATTG_16330 [Vibrio nigripulchritudo]BDU31043.1 hypothetical protein TUMSATVNIG1_16520 [Vibrio nigripulchritudo]
MIKNQQLTIILERLIEMSSQVYATPKQHAQIMMKALEQAIAEIRFYDITCGELVSTFEDFKGEYTNRQFLSQVIGKDLVNEHSSDLRSLLQTLQEFGCDWDKTVRHLKIKAAIKQCVSEIQGTWL